MDSPGPSAISDVYESGPRMTEASKQTRQKPWQHSTYECDQSCPLRAPLSYLPDPPLPPVKDVLSLTREEVSAQLYTPIREWQTRFLQLHPDEFGTNISASLIVADLVHISGAVLHQQQQRVQYNALSYTWGAETFARVITINDIEFPITENLFAFLQRYRSMDTTTYIWIDAVCINQFDLEEKAAQVGQMLTIYTKAHTVVVWLGEEGPHTKRAGAYLKWPIKHGSLRSVQHSRGCMERAKDTVDGIADLCSRKWVRRIWVKQETWAAKRLKVLCGTSSLDWSQYTSAPEVKIYSIGNREYNDVHPTLKYEDSDCLEHLESTAALSSRELAERRNLASNDIHELLHLLNHSVNCQTSNEHDRIYALFGIAGISPPGDQGVRTDSELSIPVDYTISLETLYQRLAMSLMLYSGPYCILATDGTFGARTELGLPSWTPDFRCPTRCMLLQTQRLTAKAERSFRRINPDATDKVLRLRGYRIATIVNIAVPEDTWTKKALLSAPENMKALLAGRLGKQHILANTDLRPGSSTPLENYPFLEAKYVRADVEPWCLEKVTYMAESWLASGHGWSSAIAHYVRSCGAFAASAGAVAGDVVIVAEGVGVPVVLGPLGTNPDVFNFVSCAWLFDCNSPSAKLNVGEYDPWLTRLRDELLHLDTLTSDSVGDPQTIEIFSVE